MSRAHEGLHATHQPASFRATPHSPFLVPAGWDPSPNYPAQKVVSLLTPQPLARGHRKGLPNHRAAVTAEHTGLACSGDTGRAARGTVPTQLDRGWGEPAHRERESNCGPARVSSRRAQPAGSWRGALRPGPAGAKPAQAAKYQAPSGLSEAGNRPQPRRSAGWYLSQRRPQGVMLPRIQQVGSVPGGSRGAARAARPQRGASGAGQPRAPLAPLPARQQPAPAPSHGGGSAGREGTTHMRSRRSPPRACSQDRGGALPGVTCPAPARRVPRRAERPGALGAATAAPRGTRSSQAAALSKHRRGYTLFPGSFRCWERRCKQPLPVRPTVSGTQPAAPVVRI